MLIPALEDTIIAVSSAWCAAPLGILRLSGPESFALARSAGATPPASETRGLPTLSEARLLVEPGVEVPATVFWFSRPRSYTGQDLVEMHVVGCLPLLRALSARLVGAGARRALPGEFTARAFLTGKIDAQQVDGIHSAIHAAGESSARLAARLGRGAHGELIEHLRTELTDLLARIEAGIDFVDEEDVSFVSPREVCASLDEMRARIRAFGIHAGRASARRRPQVALAGMPNAGKSTLFNALLGYERAIVSPVLGTTRDVLSAEIEWGGVALVLQDCAGLGESAEELEIAAHRAAELAVEHADLVLWVHDRAAGWTEAELAACGRIPEARRLLVLNKSDLSAAPAESPIPISFVRAIETSAARGTGLDLLRDAFSSQMATATRIDDAEALGTELREIDSALERASQLADRDLSNLQSPELIALELRRSHGLLESESGSEAWSEAVLGRIFSSFCVGK